MKGPLSRPVVPLAGLDACRPKVLSGFGITTCINIIVMRRFHSIQFLDVSSTCVWQTWQRPTLPRLETKYHQRWSVSRPSSEWDRVQPLRHNHQVGKTHVIREAVFVPRRRLLQFAFGRKPASASPVFRRPRGASGRRPIRRVSAGQIIVFHDEHKE